MSTESSDDVDAVAAHEPSAAEYDALGAAIGARVRRRERRNRVLQLCAVGVASAALAVTVGVAGGFLSPAPGGEAVARAPVAAHESGSLTTCYSSAGTDAATVTIDPGSDAVRATVDDAAESIRVCARIWAAGVFSGPEPPWSNSGSEVESLDVHAPDLVACRGAGGVTAVLPDSDRRGANVCGEWGAHS